MSDPSSVNRDEGARLLQAGDLTGAVRQLELAVSLNPTDYRAYAYLGVAKARMGDPASGISYLQHAVGLQPADANLRYNLATALYQAGRLPEARVELQQVLAANPAHPTAADALNRVEQALQAGGAAPAGGYPQPPPAASPMAPPSPPTGPAYLSGDTAPAWQSAPDQASTSYPPGGMSFTADVPPKDTYRPSLGRRLLRGWLWGAVFGQWWTLWTVASMFLWGTAAKQGMSGTVILAIVYGVVYAFAGSLAGIIIGLTDADDGKGAGIGIAVAMGLLVLEIRYGGGWSIVNIFFYFVTGRFIGAGIANKVQQPV